MKGNTTRPHPFLALPLNPFAGVIWVNSVTNKEIYINAQESLEPRCESTYIFFRISIANTIGMSVWSSPLASEHMKTDAPICPHHCSSLLFSSAPCGRQQTP